MALPYLSSYSYTNSNYQSNDGSIISIQIAGGAAPYFVNITGPNGYIQNYVSPPAIPDQLNLEPGTYFISVSDAAGDVAPQAEILIEEKPETFLTANISDACNCPNCDCVVTISNYVHNSNCFTYNLYDGTNPVPIATYNGCIGDEYHQFTGLCTGDYRVEAIETDGILYTFLGGEITESEVGGENAINEVTFEEPCELCYKATNCENPAEQILVTLPAEFPALDTSVTYVFNEFPDKCWTVEESDECGGGANSSILVNTGFIDASQNLGVEDQQDFNWEVIQGDVPVPTPAIITNQSFPGYGTLFNALWINQLVSPHLVGISQPSIYETTFVLPSGFNPTFTFELLSDVRAIVTLNGFIIADNSNPVTYPDPLGTPATFTTSNPIHFNPSPAINTLQVSVSITGEEKNGFVLAGVITSPGDPLESTLVTIQEIFASCDECNKTCYELTDCEGERDPIQTDTDLSQYVGQVITILTCPETCWTVTEIECSTVTDTVYIKDAFIDCLSCLPSPEPVTPFEVKARTVKPGYNTKGCSPEYVEKISCDYSEALYQEVITKRYGIEFCCSLDFDALDIKKQLMDFKMITDPEACTRIECRPPCNVEAELLTFNPTACPPPFDIQAVLVIGDD
jgi:hypothetical protein